MKLRSSIFVSMVLCLLIFAGLHLVGAAENAAKRQDPAVEKPDKHTQTDKTEMGVDKPEKASSKGFELRLGIKNGHLRETFFGCNTEASKGVDRELDMMAPPPGRGTGYTAFVNPGKGVFLYKDYQKVSDDMSWFFTARVFSKEKPVKISWKPEKFPHDYQFKILFEDKDKRKPIDMHKNNSLVLKESAVFEINGKLKNAKANASGDQQNQNGDKAEKKEAGKNQAE